LHDQLIPLYGLLKGLAEVEVLAGAAITRAFAEARESCTFWEFKGGTGTYLRAKTLPELARMRNRPIRIRVDVIDPADLELCAAYAQFSHQAPVDLWPLSGASETGRQVQTSCLATILAVCWHNQNSLLEIDLRLSSTWSTLRFDRSDDGLLITVRDKGAPAYRVPSPANMYADYLTHLAVGFRQGRPVLLGGSVAQYLSEEPLVSEVRPLFEGLGLPLDAYTDDDVALLIQKAMHPSNPYD
jgi:hypothetical protein